MIAEAGEVDEVLAAVATELPAHDIAPLPMTPTGKVSKAQLLVAFS